MEQQKHTLTPKFFFLSLGVLVSLIASVTSFLNLVFATLDKKFPDALNAVYTYGYNTYDYQAMRTALATLIIMFPIFLILSRFWTKSIRGELARVDAIIKKWMLYLIIFLSGLVIAVDLVTLVRYFVSGEITTRFILKVVITLVVAAMVGMYYMWELRGMRKILGCNIGTWMAIKSAILVGALIVFSFAVMGSPMKQRAYRLDERRVQDIQSIQWQVISYWQQKEKLPETLKELSNPISSYMVPVDPEFQKGFAYEYQKTGDLSFKLCATFAEPMPEGWSEYGGGSVPMYGGVMRDVATSAVAPYPGVGGDSWDHEAGRTCYDRTIDKDLYPPYSKSESMKM